MTWSYFWFVFQYFIHFPLRFKIQWEFHNRLKAASFANG